MRLGMGRKKIRIGDILVAAGAITEEQLQEALAYQKENGGKLGNVLVDLGMISNEILITLLTQQLGIDYIAKGRDPHGYHRFNRVGNFEKGANECLRYSKISRI